MVRPWRWRVGRWDAGQAATAEHLRGLATAAGAGAGSGQQAVAPTPDELLASVDRLAYRRDPPPAPKQDLARDAWTIVEGERVTRNVSE